MLKPFVMGCNSFATVRSAEERLFACPSSVTAIIGGVRKSQTPPIMRLRNHCYPRKVRGLS